MSEPICSCPRITTARIETACTRDKRTGEQLSSPDTEGAVSWWLASSTPETVRRAYTGAVSRFCAARGGIPICYARSYRHLGKCSVCHRHQRQDVWRAREQYLVLMPHGAVYRYATCAVIAAGGSIRYDIDARDRTFGLHECSISFSAARSSIRIRYARSERRPGKCPVCPSLDTRDSVSRSLQGSILVSPPGPRCPLQPSAGIRSGNFVQYAYSQAARG